MQQKNRFFYLLLIGLCLLLYVFNRFYLKQHSDGLLWRFSVSYFSDLLAPLVLLSIANFSLSFCGRSMEKLWQALLFALACGLVWELPALLRLERVSALLGSTFDPADFVAYLAGGFLFWLVMKTAKAQI